MPDDDRDIADFLFGQVGQPSKELVAPRNRNVSALFNLWKSRLDGREMPEKTDIRAPDMVRFLRSVYIVDILDDGRDFRIRLFGSGVADMLRRDYTGTVLSETPPELHWRGNIYKLAYQRRMPIFYLFELTPFERPTVLTENALLPLANKQGDLAHLLCISVELSPKHTAFYKRTAA